MLISLSDREPVCVDVSSCTFVGAAKVLMPVWPNPLYPHANALPDSVKAKACLTEYPPPHHAPPMLILVTLPASLGILSFVYLEFAAVIPPLAAFPVPFM